MDIIQKSWKITTPPLKKLLSRTITHRLSREINKDNFEVVYEGYLDAHNLAGEQPDVVIYTKTDLAPVMAVEICKADELLEMVLIAKNTLDHYPLKEFFIYDYESEKWYLVNDREDSPKQTSFSNFFSLDLRETIRLFPHLSA